MGHDKAFLRLNGKTLLERALELGRALTQEVWIVGDVTKFTPFGRVVVDIYPGCGPLGGIHSALSTTGSAFNLILAVDTPFVPADFLAHLAAVAVETGATVTLPRAGDGWQPLCAVYRREFARVAEVALRQGRNKIDPLFAGVQTHVIESRDLEKLGFSQAIFRNLNTPEEWDQALSETAPQPDDGNRVRRV